jgi:hypothetical protein
MQPQDPSTVEPDADATASVEQVSEPAESTSASPPWWRRMWRGRDEGSAPAQGEESAEQTAPSTVTLTEEEINRRVQAETDRREYKRQADARDAERKRLRDEDPWAYAEQERQAEHAAVVDWQTQQFLGTVGVEHDKYTLDPLVMQLPEDERKRILQIQGAGVGLDGRKLIVTEGLKALEKHWKAEGAKEAEARLRHNPAFRKQVLGEFRRGVAEPEFIAGGPATAADRNLSDMLRARLGQHHSA